MRFAVGCASSGNFDGVKDACVFMRKLLAKCEYLSGMGRVKDWPGKVEVMRSSTIKVETGPLFNWIVHSVCRTDVRPDSVVQALLAEAGVS